MMHLGELIQRHARYRPDHTAVVCGGDRLGYAAFDRAINRLANALLARGLRKGDKIAALLPNCIELITLYWTAARTGLVMVPMSPLLTARGLSGLLQDSDSVALIAHAETADLAEEALANLNIDASRRFLVGGERSGFVSYDAMVAEAGDLAPPDAALESDDLFNIVYSSGTTGDPKGIMHSHLVRVMYAVLFAGSWRIVPESVVLHTGAIIFNGAFVTLMPCFYAGASYILHETFDAEAVVDSIEREGVTHTMMVPSQIVALMDSPAFSPARLQSLQMILSLGAPLHLEHKTRLQEALPGRFHELYGITEGFVTILDKTDAARKPDSVGVPGPFFDVRIVDENGGVLAAGEIGEIVGRGPIMMNGYYKRPDLTAETIRNGWIHSGDLGYLDEDGFLYLVDRMKDMIISGGVNVYPRDIEEIVVRHPDVQEAAVFGVPDTRWGELPIAAVVLREPGSVGPDALKDWINDNVEAKYQRVRDVLVLDAFPKNAAGKILKRELRDAYAPPADRPSP